MQKKSKHDDEYLEDAHLGSAHSSYGLVIGRRGKEVGRRASRRRGSDGYGSFCRIRLWKRLGEVSDRSSVLEESLILRFAGVELLRRPAAWGTINRSFCGNRFVCLQDRLG